MTRIRSASARRLAAVLLVALAACAPAEKPAGGSTTPAPAASAAAGPYDPRTDPLVNPKEMFEPAPADPAAIAEDETLYRTLEGNPANLNPLFISATVEFYFAEALFGGLFTFDKDMKWKVSDEWVEKFEESPDHLVYTVTLKPGLKHQDGHAITAEDVRWSFYEIIDPRVPCPSVKTGKDKIAKVEALDERTVRITHTEALATSKWNAGWTVLPKHVYDKDKKNNPDLKSGDYYNQLNRAPVGNGPYKIVEWIENDKIVLERWDEYFGRKPHFKRMVFRIIPDQNVHLLSFNRGDVDEFRLTAKQFATQTLPGSDFAKVGHKMWWPEWSFSYLAWNGDGSNPFFSDRRVRQAMSHACDVPRMNRDLAFNLYQRATGPFHPDSWMHKKGLEPYAFDLARAGQLLDEAGWKVDEEREGWRHKTIDGKPVKFEFTLLIPQGAQISIDLAAILQQDLRSIGVDMKQQILEWATFQERTRKHEFHASIAAFGTGVDPYTLRNLFHSAEYVPDGSRGRNYAAYRNPRVDALFEQGLLEFDPVKRAALYQEINQHLYDDQPFTFLWHRGTLWALNQRIRGVTAGPRGIFNFEPADRIWWVPASQARVATDQKM